jgi:hypothetical protein
VILLSELKYIPFLWLGNILESFLAVAQRASSLCISTMANTERTETPLFADNMTQHLTLIGPQFTSFSIIVTMIENYIWVCYVVCVRSNN